MIIRHGKGHKAVAFEKLNGSLLRDAVRMARAKGHGAPAATKEPPAVRAVRAALRRAGLAAVTVSLRAERFAFGNVAPTDFARLAAVLARTTPTAR